MFNLMAFRDRWVATLTETLNGVISELKAGEIYCSNEFLVQLARYLDLAVSIDTMKNFKGSMNNDLSMYKRYWRLIEVRYHSFQKIKAKRNKCRCQFWHSLSQHKTSLLSMQKKSLQQ